MSSVLWTCILILIGYILGVKFLGYHNSFCLDGCNIFPAATPTTWCQPPNQHQAIFHPPKQNSIHFKHLLRKLLQSSIVFKVKSNLPGLAFKNPDNLTSTFSPHVYFLHYPWCSLGADHLVSLILESCRTEPREYRLAGLCNPWQYLAHSRTRMGSQCLSCGAHASNRRPKNMLPLLLSLYLCRRSEIKPGELSLDTQVDREFFQITWVQKFRMAHAFDLPMIGDWVK